MSTEMNIFGLSLTFRRPGHAGRWSLWICCACLAASSGYAQGPSLQEMHDDLTLFSGILSEALKLNDSGGLFGRSLGGISSTYLVNQGAVFEVRSPLANRRNRMGLASLSSAMQSLQLQENPFLAMRRSMPTVSLESPSLAADSTIPDDRYQLLRDQIANIDFSLVVNTAVQQATHSVRALRALGSVDEATYNALFGEIESLRGRVGERVDELRLLEAELRNSSSVSSGARSSDDARDALAARLEALMQQLSPIREEALTLAAELKEKAAQAEIEFADQWQRDLTSLEGALYASLCAYGETLERIPADESLSFVLKGLGDEPTGARRTDKVHIVLRSDLSRCVEGEIDWPQLRSGSVSYSY